MRQLYLVTHAESVHQAEGLTGGWYDTGLTEVGRRQAERIALSLGDQIGGREVVLFSSDLLRAAETARVIGRFFQVDPIFLPQLRELGHGEAEGRPKSWLQAHQHPPSAAAERLDDRICTGAESFRSCAERIYVATARIAAVDRANLIVVCHSLALSYLVMAWLRVPLAGLSDSRLLTAPAGLTLLREDDLGRRSLVYLNRTDHLQD
jgi:probable phosphoglycerate mutase